MVSYPPAFSFVDKTGETLKKLPGQINGDCFYLQNLVDCDVHIMDHTSAVYADNLKNCRVHIGPVNGPCKISNSYHCTFSIATQQLRTKTCEDLTVYLFAVADPHIELSKNIRFGPYNYAYPMQNSHFGRAGFDPKTNLWSHVFDHNPVPGETHYELMDPCPIEGAACRLPNAGPP